MQPEHDNYRDENKPVEGFAQLYEVYQIIIEDLDNTMLIKQKISTMTPQALCLLASLSRSPVVIVELYKLYATYLPILIELAKNPAIPEEFLDEMSYSKVEDLIAAVAGNRNTPIPALERLSTHDRGYIRRATASNASLPIEALQKLLDDSNSLVVSTALKALRSRDDSALHDMPDSWVRKILS